MRGARKGVTGQFGTLIIFDGDSRTVGANGYGPYTTPCAATLRSNGANIEWRNFGIAGQTVAQMIADASVQVDGLLKSRRGICVLWGGYNDHAGGGADAATIEASLWSYCDARRAAGWKMVVCSELPAADNTWQAVCDTLNPNILAHWSSHADALADLGADATMGVWANRDNTTYYSDQTHPTDAGYAIIAGIVASAVATLL